MPPHSTTGHILSISRCDRWQIYARLQELDIPADCLGDGRLQVNINSPYAAFQTWSVIRQFTSSRQSLIDRLERCWHGAT